MDFLHNLGIDPKLVLVQVVGFLIFLWLMTRFVYKPIFGILEERQNNIKETYDQLDADREAMLKTRREYEQRLADIENQARERIQAAVKEAQELRASIIEEANKKAQSSIQAGLATLESERARTLVELRAQVADLAIEAATRVVGESLDNARQRALVNDFIASVGAAPMTAGKKASANGSGAGAN